MSKKEKKKSIQANVSKEGFKAALLLWRVRSRETSCEGSFRLSEMSMLKIAKQDKETDSWE